MAHFEPFMYNESNDNQQSNKAIASIAYFVLSIHPNLIF